MAGNGAEAAPDKERVTGNFLRLGAGELLARAVGFLVLIYLARVLGAGLYGLVGFAYAVILYLGTLTDFGIETLGPREVVTRTGELERLASAVLTARVLIGGALSAGLALFALLFLSQPDASTLAIYGLVLLPTGGSARWIHLGLERAGPVAWSRVAGEAVRALLTLVLVRGPADVLLVPLAHFAGEGVAALVMLAALRARGLRIRPRWDPATAVPVLRSGGPLVIAVIMGMVIYNSDLLLLRVFRSTTEVGWYFAAYALITLLGNLSMSYGANLLPALSRVGSTSERGLALYQHAIAQVTFAGLPLAVGGYLLAPQLLALVYGPAYAPAVPVLQILLLTTPLLLLRLVQHAALYSRGRQERVMWATTAAAVLNLSVNLVVIPRFGMVGAAWTTLLSEILRTGLVQLYVIREGFTAAVLRRVWRPAAASAAMAALLVAVPFATVWAGLAVGTVGYIGFLFVVRGIELQPGKLPTLRI